MFAVVAGLHINCVLNHFVLTDLESDNPRCAFKSSTWVPLRQGPFLSLFLPARGTSTEGLIATASRNHERHRGTIFLCPYGEHQRHCPESLWIPAVLPCQPSGLRCPGCLHVPAHPSRLPHQLPHPVRHHWTQEAANPSKLHPAEPRGG